MSDIDRVSIAGVNPAPTIADRQRDRGNSSGRPPPDSHDGGSDPEPHPPHPPHPPKSIIDEYA